MIIHVCWIKAKDGRCSVEYVSFYNHINVNLLVPATLLFPTWHITRDKKRLQFFHTSNKFYMREWHVGQFKIFFTTTRLPPSCLTHKLIREEGCNDRMLSCFVLKIQQVVTDFFPVSVHQQSSIGVTKILLKISNKFQSKASRGILELFLQRTLAAVGVERSYISCSSRKIGIFIVAFRRDVCLLSFSAECNFYDRKYWSCKKRWLKKNSASALSAGFWWDGRVWN